MAKKITKKIKLVIAAGKATPAPPVGTALGPAGINIGEFVKQFNDAKTCLNYVSVVMSNKNFIESLQLPQLQIFGIDGKNYANVIIHNDLGGFMAFYNDYYL